jgi:small subunit ribosomal protein S36
MLTRTEALPEAPGAGGRLSAVPGVVWLLVVMQTAWLLCIGVVYPAFQSPDEVAHLDYVVAMRHGEWLDDPGDRLLQSGILNAYGSVPATHSERHQSDAHQPLPRGERRSFDELGTAPAPPQSLPNQMVQHPPLYYASAAGYTWLIPGFSGRGFDIQVFWLRLLSTLLLAPVPLLLFLAGRRLLLSDRAALVAAALPLAVPSYLRTGASVNNDSLLVLFGAVLALLLARALAGDLRTKTAALIGLVWGAMLLTKGLALLVPPVIVAAYLAGAGGGLLARVRAALLPSVVAGAVGTVVGGWWWVRNVALYGKVQPRGYGDAWPTQRIYGIRPGASNGEFLHGVGIRLVKRAFGSLGLLDGPALPFALVVTLFVLLCLGVLAGVVLGLPGARSPRLAGLVLLAPVGLCLLLILVQIHPIYWQSRLFPGIQVRYFLPFVAGLVLPVALAVTRLAGRRSRWVPAAIVTAVATYSAGVMLWYVAREFGSAHGGTGHALRTGLDYVLGWAPWPPAYAVVCAVVGLVSTVLVVVRSSGLPAGVPEAVSVQPY